MVAFLTQLLFAIRSRFMRRARLEPLKPRSAIKYKRMSIHARIGASPMTLLSSALRMSVLLGIVIALSTGGVDRIATAAEGGAPRPPTIPAGSVVTNGNWRQYASFMPVGMQAIFAGDHFWRMPVDVQIEVGPSVPIALPRRYMDDTATLSRQVSLVHLADGGYIPSGYVAGIPFPQPERDQTLSPYEIFYDTYFHYAPRVQRNFSCNYTSDCINCGHTKI